MPKYKLTGVEEQKLDVKQMNYTVEIGFRMDNYYY
jgi:hypothetical protein|tara:strand:- start:76662 stop:76766 length:105 start_codon:yes stop_codon:yes gene_type:complete